MEEAVLSWYPFSPNHPVQYNLHVEKDEFEREDTLTLAITEVTEIEEFGFQTKIFNTDFPRFEHNLAEFRWYYDRNVVKIERTVYNTFMLLGDVGGLFGLFVSLASSLLNILNYQKAENILVSDLYHTEEAAASPE